MSGHGLLWDPCGLWPGIELGNGPGEARLLQLWFHLAPDPDSDLKRGPRTRLCGVHVQYLHGSGFRAPSTAEAW